MFMRHGAPVAEHFASTQNDRSQVTLSDGSVVSLNWGSAIDVTFSDTERRIMLRRGEAFFAVAKNPKRPFIVDAGDRRIAALGTQFEVRLDRDRVEVVLLEGKVSVKDTGHNEQSSLLPNERLVAVRGAATLITQVNAQKQTSWRQGWLEFENDTLADAIAEFNRYSPQPIMLADPKVGALRISGVFHLSPPQRFAALVQELLPVKVDQDSEGRTQLRLAATSVRPGRSE
ncbi:MAG TPA: FecR domain-containing protein [Xanthobacteraceae bacterium]